MSRCKFLMGISHVAVPNQRGGFDEYEQNEYCDREIGHNGAHVQSSRPGEVYAVLQIKKPERKTLPR